MKVTAGADDAERCSQAFTVAAAGVAAGAEVSLWLTGEAAWFAVPGRAEAFELTLATPLADLLAVVLEGGAVTLCTQCAARRGITDADTRQGVRLAGAASFVEECLSDGVQALVY
ncbi:DsrE family protein [soil metagenome]